MSMHNFSCSVGPGVISTKCTLGHITPNLSFASGAQNADTLFFLLGWDQWGFHKKLTGTRYTKILFLDPV
jgi:hypothetical protein